MLIAGLGDEQIAGTEPNDMFLSMFPPMHIDVAVQDDKRFSAIIDVPAIRLVGPMEAHAGTLDFHQVLSPPGTVRSEPADVRDNLGHAAKMGALRQMGKAGPAKFQGGRHVCASSRT